MKYFLVVGASKGIGREFIKKLLKNKKNRVLLISRSNVNIESKNVTHFKTDLLNEDDIRDTLKRIKKMEYKIDSLLFAQKYRPASTAVNNLREELLVNVEATKIIIEGLKQSFNKKGLKSIVVIGSIASAYVADEQAVDYHISKSALVGLVNYYAVTLGGMGIRINMVSPSTVIKDENRSFYNNNKILYDLYSMVSPLNSVLGSKDVVNLIKYLLFKKSKFITGQDIIIDGAISLQWQESLARKISNITNKLTQ